ncbi:hypothetical protein AN958_08347 [Leucoagaricus sp. SymC.cos]|nr:hypothetical protein AN958_08347 [Leucoagaricus sp. SymC.cos]
MGLPSNSPIASSFIASNISTCSSKCDVFPHDYIWEKGYVVFPSEEQTMCTVYQATPPENRAHLKNGLMNYIDWRCSAKAGHRHIDHSIEPDALHLCTHIDKNIQPIDNAALTEFAHTLESDGITRLDLLWNMKSYRIWFDNVPGANEVVA